MSAGKMKMTSFGRKILMPLKLQIGNSSNECVTLDCSVQLDYDSPNQRIRLKVSFPRGGCYHATVSLAGLQLHNGDFDIIVLDSTCTHISVIISHRCNSPFPYLAVHNFTSSLPQIQFTRSGVSLYGNTSNSKN